MNDLLRSYANFKYDTEVELAIKAGPGRKPRKPHLPQDPTLSPPLPSFLSIMSSILSPNFPKSDARIVGAKHQ